ncbi:DUF3016 domain-containing protein [Shewanella sp. AS1]|uniref:DUF3016 domain-containing protein n=1 Tax=Shewanella sp. AS1 TaxID=2907626 RepID=UPI001F45D1F4|nr:DUF3016 domain-containing protein [Shewanella sp. AS1]MCE9679831.1 DUF3016 domain-containing protein [Shewanella sp. AS1]
MKRKLLLLLATLASWNLAANTADENSVTQEGVVKITWKKVDDYQDVKAVSDIQSRYQQRVFDTLTKNINKSASKILKPNQTLEMVVTDVDLAGDVRPTFGATPNDIRLVKDIYPPLIVFSYQVLEEGKVIIAGDEKLRDMGFMQTIGVVNDKPFRYETNMLDGWLKKTVAPQL